jgi:DNA-binding PadR family transcriptional regulator
MQHGEPRSFLPLSEVAFEILLALADRDCHGYHLIRGIEERTKGRLALHAGTLYRALSRLRREGLIEELDERPDPELDDERRRYYRLTKLGRDVARAEARRLASQVGAARRKHWLEPGSDIA